MMNEYKCLRILETTLVEGRHSTTMAFMALLPQSTSRRRNQKPSRSSSSFEETKSPTKQKVSAEELAKRISEHKKAAQELREKERELHLKKLQQEVQSAEEAAQSLRLAEEEKRRLREDDLRSRLEAMQLRREQRELEHEVSKRRSRAVVNQRSTMDVIQQRISSLEQEEEERRKSVLHQIRQRFQSPVQEGIEDINRLLANVKERSRLREAELREHRLSDDHFVPSHQGKVYEHAMLEFAKARNNFNDEKHERAYRLAKMNEYGKVIGRVTNIKTKALPPIVSISSKETHELSCDERRKVGDEYMRTAGVRKPDLAARLPPICESEQSVHSEIVKIKERDTKGLQYLRELREKVELVRQRKPREVFDKSQVVQEIKQLRVQTNLLERRLLYGRKDESVEEASAKKSDGRISNVKFEGDESGLRRQTSEESSYVDVINAKLEMLRRIEELRKRAAHDDSKW